MIKKNLILTIALLMGIVNLGLFGYLNRKVNDVIVIDVIKTVNEFKMKKDLEAKVEGKLQEYTSQIDSIKAVMTAAQKNNASPEQLGKINEELNNAQQQAQQAYTIANKKINEQVWTRLNTLIDEFGKQNGYRIVIGANGMGTVLYNEGSVEKTAELIKYINSKYEKGN